MMRESLYIFELNFFVIASQAQSLKKGLGSCTNFNRFSRKHFCVPFGHHCCCKKSPSKMSQFQLSINIKDMKTQDLVAYKIDGQRFGTSAKTMKFFTGDIYELTVCAKPVQQLLRLVIGGKEVPLKQKPGDSGTFIGQWTAHIPPQRNGKREDIHFSIVGKFGALSTVWQCKFYNSADEHGGWGDKLTGLYYTCSLVEGGFRITDEQYH